MSRVELETVEKLTIQVVVDNVVEWMNPLPPGFTHEVPQKVLSNPPPDVETGSKGIIDIPNYCCGGHGLSVLIKTTKDGVSHSTLFDTGPDPKLFERNYTSLNLDALTPPIERIVISHYHGDHTGGIPMAIKLLNSKSRDRPVIVDAHPDRPKARSAPFAGPQNGWFRLPYDPTHKDITDAGALIDFHADEHVVADSTVYVSGEIPRVAPFETGMPGHMKWAEDADHPAQGKWVDDPFVMEERYVAVDVADKGMIVFSACSHAGIVNVVKHAAERFGKPIYMVLGGLHLGGLMFRPRLEPTVHYLSKELNPAPKYVVPLHCSGSEVKFLLHQAFGEGCVNIGSGVRIDL